MAHPLSSIMPMGELTNLHMCIDPRKNSRGIFPTKWKLRRRQPIDRIYRGPAALALSAPYLTDR
jgi:hypothetical protein